MRCVSANIFYFFTYTHTRINKVQGFPEIDIGERQKKIIVIVRREVIRITRTMTLQDGHRKSIHAFLYNDIAWSCTYRQSRTELKIFVAPVVRWVRRSRYNTRPTFYKILLIDVDHNRQVYAYYIILLYYHNDIIATGIARITEIKVTLVLPTITMRPRNKLILVRVYTSMRSCTDSVQGFVLL